MIFNFILYILIIENIIMKESHENPLGLENKLYTSEEFGALLRDKFGADSSISNVILTEIFISKYPSYSCRIKKSQNHINQKSCGCC